MSKNMRAVAVAEVPRPIAFDSLILEHMNMLYAVALRFTRNRADAQDLTQNAVVKALRFHGSFEKGTYIKAWLLTILRNTFINDYRRKTRRPALVELTGTEAAKSSAPDLELAYEPSEEGSTGLMELLDDEVRRAVDSLPDKFKAAVIIRDVEGKSYKEIAVALGCPLGTVMSRLYRGRKLLRERLYVYAKGRRIVGEKNRPRRVKLNFADAVRD